MYGLPENVDLGFVRDRELIQILVGQYQLILRFDGDFSISTEGEFDHILNGACQLRADSLPSAAASLLRLVGTTVVRAESVGGGELHLHFASGDIVCLKDSNPEGESYEIQGPNVHLVV